MKKTGIYFLCIFMLVASLTGCSSSKPKDEVTTDSGQKESVMIFDESKTYENEKYDSGKITGQNVTIKNMTFEQDLIIDKEVGDGNVYLDGVNIKGKLIINGGGENSIRVDNCSLNVVESDRKEGAVHIVISENSSVDSFSIASETILDISGAVKTLNVSQSATGSTVDVKENAKVTGIVVNAAIDMSVKSPISQLDVNAGSNISVESTITNLNITNGAQNTLITLGKEAVVSSLATETLVDISGQGKLGQVFTNNKDNITGTVKAESTTVSDNPISNAATQPSPSPTVEVKPTPQPTASPKPTVAPTQTPLPTVEPTAAPQPTATPVPTSKWDGVSVDTAWYDDSKTSFTINKAEELAGLAKLVNEGNSFENKAIKLGLHIDLDNKEWTPIGQTIRSGDQLTGTIFKGIFDGNNYTIKNLSITNISLNNEMGLGLFSSIYGEKSEVKNVVINGTINVSSNRASGLAVGLVSGKATVKNVVTSGTVTAETAGGIIGRGLVGSTVIDCTNNAKVETTGAKAGGIAGTIYYAGPNVIDNCINNGIIKSSEGNSTNSLCVGGIVGFYTTSAGTIIKNSTNNGSITSSLWAGGIAGNVAQNDDSQTTVAFENCTNTGSVTGEINVGGIVGYGIIASNGKSKDVLEKNSIIQCKNSGTITGLSDKTMTGGIAGAFSGSILQSTNSGNVSSAGTAGGIVGKSEDSIVGLTIDNCQNAGNVISTLLIPNGQTTYQGSLVGEARGKLIINNFAENATLSLFGYMEAPSGNPYDITINGNQQLLKNALNSRLYKTSKITLNNVTLTDLFTTPRDGDKVGLDFDGNGAIKKYTHSMNNVTINVISDDFIINEVFGDYSLKQAKAIISINNQRIEFEKENIANPGYYYDNLGKAVNWNEMDSIRMKVVPQVGSDTSYEVTTFKIPMSLYGFTNNESLISKNSLNGQDKMQVEVKNPNGETSFYKIYLVESGELARPDLGGEGVFVNKNNTSEKIEIKKNNGIYQMSVNNEPFGDISIDRVEYNSDGTAKVETINRFRGGYQCYLSFTLDKDNNSFAITNKSNMNKYPNINIGDIFEYQDMTPHITDASLKFQENENVVVDFSLDKSITMNNYDNSIDKTELTEIYNDLITGKTDDIQRAAAQKIGNDIVIAYYTFDNQGNKIPLLTGGKNPLVKFKAWDGYLNQKINDDYVQLKGITVEGITTYIGVNVPGNSSWRTSTNPSTGTPSVGWLDDVRGKQIGVDIIVICEGIIARESLKVDVPAYNETDFSLNKTELQLSVNGTDKLTISRQGTNLPAKWSSSDSNVVTVDAEGNLKAIAPGTATISVRALGFGITKTTIVTVSSSDKNGLSLYEDEGSIIDSLPVDNTQNDIEETKDLPIDEPKEEPALQPEEETDTTTDGDQEVVIDETENQLIEENIE